MVVGYLYQVEPMDFDAADVALASNYGALELNSMKINVETPFRQLCSTQPKPASQQADGACYFKGPCRLSPSCHRSKSNQPEMVETTQPQMVETTQPVNST